MEVIIKIIQLLLSLSILVVIHEFGHFIAAKAFKTKVEKFYLFFNPWFSIFKFKYGETEYGIGWLPLGGYVKIAGMIDESMDKEALKKPPQPWEFRSKPSWQRLIIMLGGVTMNIILAVMIYIFMLVIWGEEYLPTSEIKYGIRVDSLAMEAGLRNGDKILSVDNEYSSPIFSICSGANLAVLPFPPATLMPRFNLLKDCFSAPQVVVVVPEECQSKPMTQLIA